MALTAKQEAFAQAIVAGMSQADAYRTAYSAQAMKPETVQKRASELMRNGEVAGRVAALRKPVVEALQYGMTEAMKEAEEALSVARTKGNGGAMVAAVTLRAKLMGLLVEKREVRTGPLDDLPPEEAASLLETINAIQRARTGEAVGRPARSAQDAGAADHG